MLKKIITTSIISIIVSTLWVSNFALAQDTETVLFQQAYGPEGTKLERIAALPKADWRVILAETIKLVLGITGSLALIAFIVGGVMFVTAQGEEEKISKAKDILTWSLIALVIIASAYAVVLGISELVIFE